MKDMVQTWQYLDLSQLLKFYNSWMNFSWMLM
jgi:hypothetical protein